MQDNKQEEVSIEIEAGKTYMHAKGPVEVVIVAGKLCYVKDGTSKWWAITSGLSLIPESEAPTDAGRSGHFTREYFKGAPLKKEWIDSELDEAYAEMEKKFTRLDDLEKQVGELEEGQHPDERKPRAATWLQERANWQEEVEALRSKIREQEAVIYGLEEGAENWKADYENLKAATSEIPPELITEVGTTHKLYVWNGIEACLDAVADFEAAKKYIKDYCDPSDGIHPDIESIFILQRVGSIVITETGQTTEMGSVTVPVCKVDIVREPYFQLPEKREDWAIVVDDKIDIPDDLYPLFQKLAMQMNFHTISKKSRMLTLAHMVQIAEEFFSEKWTIKYPNTGEAKEYMKYGDVMYVRRDKSEWFGLEFVAKLINEGRLAMLDEVDHKTKGDYFAPIRHLLSAIPPAPSNT